MSTTLLVEAKREYTEQLVLFLRDAMYDDFYILWKESVDSPDPMMNFQDKLEDVVDWDEKTMIQKTDKCISKTGCKFLDDLIVAVFVAHMKILMSIKNDKTKEQYKLQVPTTNKFVYECLLQCSREFWKSPYLFYQNELENKIKKVQIQKNLRQAEDIISVTIKNTIRAMLPVKEIVGDVFEYDKDGDLVLDIKRSDIRSTTPKEPDVTAPTLTPNKVLDTDSSSNNITELSSDQVIPTPTPVIDLSGVNVLTTTVVGSVSGDISNSTPDVSDKVGGEDTPDEKVDTEETDILKETIENIRVMNSDNTEKLEDLEYDPFKNKDNVEVPESKEDDQTHDIDDDTSSVVDWNKGFVMGPVEDDLTVEVEPIEKDTGDSVDMSDVVELK